MRDLLRPAKITLLVMLASFASAAQEPTFTRTLNQKFTSITIENLSGTTSVQTWSSTRTMVQVPRADGDQKWIESRLEFQITSPDTLRIVVRQTANPNPINLTVYVPRQSNLSLKGGDAPVVVNGATNSLFAQTEAGPITLSVSENTNSDLSLRTLEGTITSSLQMSIFGPVNAHSLDGRLGKGGMPVILRSNRGAVTLQVDDPNRLAKADGLINLDRSSASANSVVKPARFDTAASTSAPSDSGSTALSDSAGLDVVKIDSRMVNLNVRVTDSTGKLIPDLRLEDFEIVEDNVKQEVVRFEPVTSPVNVVLLLDLSGSTKDRMKIIKRASKKFIESLSPNTPIAVAAFAHKFAVISEFTLDRKLLKDRIDDTKNLRSGTAFYDATWSTLDLLKEVKEQRKAIVVMTDGVDSSLTYDWFKTKHPFDELLERITQDEVTIYPIYFNTEFEVLIKQGGSDTHESYVTARKQLQSIADETGGTLFRAERAEDLESVYQRVASELQTLYSVSYNPADKNYDGKWRSVGVKVTRQQASAKTKRGFYAR